MSINGIEGQDASEMKISKPDSPSVLFLFFDHLQMWNLKFLIYYYNIRIDKTFEL